MKAFEMEVHGAQHGLRVASFGGVELKNGARVLISQEMHPHLGALAPYLRHVATRDVVLLTHGSWELLVPVAPPVDPDTDLEKIARNESMADKPGKRQKALFNKNDKHLG
jgi:hypothetical protein